MTRSPFLASALAFTLALAAAPAAGAPSSSLGAVLGIPQIRESGGSFSLRARIVDGQAIPGWSCRLYFDTDLNSMTGWLTTRGYEYVACPNFSTSQNAVTHTQPTSMDGLGGEWCGYGTAQLDAHTLNLSVPLGLLGPSDGRLAWELMVFDAGGIWIGSYGGRIVR